MKVYTTKCALTTGIEVRRVRYVEGSDEKFVYADERSSFSREQFVMGENAFLQYADAAIVAREMRNTREQSLKKQLKKISCLLFPAARPLHLK